MIVVAQQEYSRSRPLFAGMMPVQESTVRRRSVRVSTGMGRDQGFGTSGYLGKHQRQTYANQMEYQPDQ